MEHLLSVKGLRTEFKTKKGIVAAVDGVDFTIKKGEVLGIVGESGCGKSVTSLSILRLLPENGRIAGGSVKFQGNDLLALSEKDMCDIRGNKIAMIFQDPLSSLNPTMSIGDQMIEPFTVHRGLTKKQAREAALDMLVRVGIPSPKRRMDEYPHNLSGGMRQRVMIAMAISCAPDLLIADEPTTALDVSIQAQILELMLKLKDETGTALLLITHDMGVIAGVADNVLVMYAGKGVEYACIGDIFNSPRHPYTEGLLKSIPRLDKNVDILPVIDGTVPSHYDMPSGCRFHTRCPYKTEQCETETIDNYIVGSTVISCLKYA